MERPKPDKAANESGSAIFSFTLFFVILLLLGKYPRLWPARICLARIGDCIHLRRVLALGGRTNKESAGQGRVQHKDWDKQGSVLTITVASALRCPDHY